MSDRRLGRQAFLKLFRKGAIVTGAVFGLEVTGIDIDVRVPTPLRLWRGLAQFVTPRSQLRSLHSQLFGVQGLVDTRAGAAHAAYPHQVHPDDQMAASALRSLYRPTQAIEWEDKPWEGPPNNHAFLLGDPQSNALSRLVLSYRETEGVFELDRDPLYKPRWSSILYPHNYQAPKIKRYVAGVLREGPGYELYDHQKRKYYRSNDRDPGDWLNIDYLLVTRVLNVYSPETVESGKIAIVFGGLHGPGTRAIQLLLKEEDLLDTTDTKREDSPYYQALYRVYVRHNHSTRESYPAQIEFVGAAPLDVDQASIWNRVKRRSETPPHWTV